MNLKLPDIAKIYFTSNATVFEDIKKLNEKVRKPLFNRIIADKDEVNFFSWLSEMKFGVYFDALDFKLEYDSSISNKTPDWKLVKDDLTIYAEVLRLNLVEEKLKDQIRNLKDEFLSPGQTNAISLHNSGIMDSANFYGKESKFTEKEARYRNLIKEHQCPFILCVDCSNARLFIDYEDFSDFFIGNKKGFFYNSGEFAENVSGILIRTMWNQILYLQNPNANYQLDSSTFDNVNNDQRR